MSEFVVRGGITPFIGSQFNVEVENADELRAFWRREGITTILENGRSGRPVVTMSGQDFVSRCKPGEKVLYTIATQKRGRGIGIRGVGLKVLGTAMPDDSTATHRQVGVGGELADADAGRLLPPVRDVLKRVPVNQSPSTWRADDFIRRVLTPRIEPVWWKDLAGEVRQTKIPGRYIQDTLDAELSSDIPAYRSDQRQLWFFSTHSRTTIDGRAGSVGVEEKYTDLSFPSVIDGAIHRGIVWVIGNAQRLPKGDAEAVAVCVVRSGARPMEGGLANAVIPVLVDLASKAIHVVFVQENTGHHWRPRVGGRQDPLPNWLATIAAPDAWELAQSNPQTVERLRKAPAGSGTPRRLFDRSHTFTEVRGEGWKGAIAEWSNHWQMIEVGLLLRGAGYDAVKVGYCGAHPLRAAGRGIETAVREGLLRTYGVSLEWCVPV